MHGAARSPARHGADDRDLLPAAEDDARGVVDHLRVDRPRALREHARERREIIVEAY